MRQEFHFIEVTVVKDMPDDAPLVRHWRGIEQFLGFGLDSQLDQGTRTPSELPVFFQEPCYCLWRFIAPNAQAACHTCGRLIGSTVVTQRPPAADKLHAGHAFGTLPAAYSNETHFTRALRMRPTARRPVKIGNLHDADTIRVKTFLTERQLRCLCRRDGMETHCTIIEDHRIGRFFRPYHGV